MEWKKSLKKDTFKKKKRHVLDLPSEILQKIFSDFKLPELYSRMRPVCRRFKEVAMSPVLLQEIEVSNEIPPNTVRRWIKSAKLLKHFSATNRTDANALAEELSKNCKNLESVKLQDCWGTNTIQLLHSTPLCHLISRCKKLNTINLSQCRFLSCKFFRLISKEDGYVDYVGPMSSKQMKAFFAGLAKYEVGEVKMTGSGHLTHTFRLADVIRHMEDGSIPDLWQNINYGPPENRNLGPLAQQNDFGVGFNV